MQATTIRYSDELSRDIEFLAKKYNRTKHFIMVDNMAKSIQAEAERLRFYEDGEKIYQRLKIENNGITLDELSEKLSQVEL